MILEKLLKPFLALLAPIVNYLEKDLAGGGGGSRPAKAALALAAKRKADASRKKRAEQRSLAEGTPIVGSKGAAARQALRRPA